jgi:hypothetical protein
MLSVLRTWCVARAIKLINCVCNWKKNSIMDPSQRMNKKSDYIGKLDFISSSDVKLQLGNSGFLKVFKSSGMLWRVVTYVHPDVSKNINDFMSRLRQSMKVNALQTFEGQEQLTKRHSVTIPTDFNLRLCIIFSRISFLQFRCWG